MVYISDKITGTKDYFERFKKVVRDLTLQGYDVVNPAKANNYTIIYQ